LLDAFGSYVVTVTDNLTGCFGVSNAITVTDIDGERNTLFISPNPTTGLMSISFYNDNPTASTNRKIAVYDAKGAQIITKTFTTTGNYGYTTIDLTKYAAGNYSIVLLNDAGKQIASEIVVKY
jgi:Secretion system C-terminal sorting domain